MKLSLFSILLFGTIHFTFSHTVKEFKIECNQKLEIQDTTFNPYIYERCTFNANNLRRIIQREVLNKDSTFNYLHNTLLPLEIKNHQGIKSDLSDINFSQGFLKHLFIDIKLTNEKTNDIDTAIINLTIQNEVLNINLYTNRLSEQFLQSFSDVAKGSEVTSQMKNSYNLFAKPHIEIYSTPELRLNEKKTYEFYQFKSYQLPVVVIYKN